MSALSTLQAHISANESEEHSDKVEEPNYMGALRSLNVVKKQSPILKQSPLKGLMFVNGSKSGKVAKSVMINTDPTHNFVSEVEAQKFRLKLDVMEMDDFEVILGRDEIFVGEQSHPHSQCPKFVNYWRKVVCGICEDNLTKRTFTVSAL